jgi:phage tail-like protein
MPPPRKSPYAGFHFLVYLAGEGNSAQATLLGGFSEASGLDSAPRTTGGKQRLSRIPPALHKTTDVTLKRGLVSASGLNDWLKSTRAKAPFPRRVIVRMLDEASRPIAAWTLHNAIPTKYTGPTLSAKGGGDVAMEELRLSYETLELFEPDDH